MFVWRGGRDGGGRGKGAGNVINFAASPVLRSAPEMCWGSDSVAVTPYNARTCTSLISLNGIICSPTRPRNHGNYSSLVMRGVEVIFIRHHGNIGSDVVWYITGVLVVCGNTVTDEILKINSTLMLYQSG